MAVSVELLGGLGEAVSEEFFAAGSGVCVPAGLPGAAGRGGTVSAGVAVGSLPVGKVVSLAGPVREEAGADGALLGSDEVCAFAEVAPFSTHCQSNRCT